jgi:hypothetical protein
MVRGKINERNILIMIKTEEIRTLIQGANWVDKRIWSLIENARDMYEGMYMAEMWPKPCFDCICREVCQYRDAIALQHIISQNIGHETDIHEIICHRKPNVQGCLETGFAK